MRAPLSTQSPSPVPSDLRGQGHENQLKHLSPQHFLKACGLVSAYDGQLENGAARRSSWVGSTILSAMAIATAVSAFTLLSGGGGQPVILVVLASLAVVGVFALFSFAVGIARFDAPDLAATAVLTDHIAEGVLVSNTSGATCYVNDALLALFPHRPMASVAEIEATLLERARDDDAVFRLSRAVEAGHDWVEEIRFRAPFGAERSDTTTEQPQQSILRISVRHAAGALPSADAHMPGASADGNELLTEWRITDVTRERAVQARTQWNPRAMIEALADGQVDAALLDLPSDRIWMSVQLASQIQGTASPIGEGHGRDDTSHDSGTPIVQTGRISSILGAPFVAAANAARVASPSQDTQSKSLDHPELVQTGEFCWEIPQPTTADADGSGDAVPLRLTVKPLSERPGLFLLRQAMEQPDLSAEQITSARDGKAADGRLAATAQLNLGALDEATLAGFFETAPIAIATIDADGRIVASNPAFKDMFADHNETDQQSADGYALADLFSDDAKPEIAQLRATAAEGAAVTQATELTYGSKPQQTCRLYLAPAENGAAVAYMIDTTQQRELEQRFAQSQKMQAVGQLAGGMAHDFNNVLTTIILSCDFLLGSHRPTDPSFKDINAIKQNASRAAGLVRQLLAFSRQQTLRPRTLSLTEVISDWSILLSRSIPETIEKKITHGRNLWDVRADQSEFERVMANLTVNARDAMPDGGRLTIRTYNVLAAESVKYVADGLVPGDYVVCEVSDTGTGMAPDVRDKIFEPFFSTKDVGKGTGLGLSTVYGIIKQTGGYIFCESTVGEGTTFRILLPRYVEPKAKVRAAERSEEPSGETTTRPPSTGANTVFNGTGDMTGTGTVLLVEDEEAVRRFTARALVRQGYNVIEASTGAEAIERVNELDDAAAIDLVVSDIMMPEMDGPSLLKELRKDQPDLKIIFISGYAEDALKNLDDDENYGFLAKPFQLKELVASVKDMLAS